MTIAEELHAQAAQTYHTACALARSGEKDLADQAFAQVYRLVAEASAARKEHR
jgi:hypothetical protein